jgi:hypothetical protein
VFFPALNLEACYECPELGGGERVHGAVTGPGEAALC